MKDNENFEIMDLTERQQFIEKRKETLNKEMD